MNICQGLKYILKINDKKRLNHHLSYVLTGFLVALLGIFIFVIFFVNKDHYISKDVFEDKNINLAADENTSADIVSKTDNISDKEAPAINNKLSALQKTQRQELYSQDIPILMYHYVEEAPPTTTLPGIYLDPKIFENQLSELNTGKFKTVFVSELARSINSKKLLPDKSIALTFDDGYEDFYKTIYPLLQKYKIKATIYVIINALDKKGYLTKQQVRELATSEFVEIGSHTFNHLDLNTLSNRRAGSEIVDSKRALENISGKPVLTFCYPFGHFKDYDAKLVTVAGYLGSVTTRAGISHSQASINTLTRLRPGTRHSQEFLNWLNSLYVKN